MLIPTAHRKAIHQYLFNEGVIVIKKDYHLAKHPDLPIPVPNIEVIKALQSLKSRGLVSLQFSWQYFYYVLTEEGITHLRQELHLPDSVVPSTVAKALKSSAQQAERRTVRGEREERRGPREGGYRRRDDGEKKVGPSADFKPEFHGGNRAPKSQETSRL